MIETGDNLIYLPVRVDAGAAGSETDDMAKINKQAIEPLNPEDVFRYSGVCSNDNMDSYFTRMDPQTTLQNYVQDLQNGVALLEGHDHDKNPYGRSFDAQLIGDGQTNSVRGSWYLIRGLQMNGGSTDSFIRAITGGIIRDMSVGFGGPDIDYVCSADGKSLWDSPFMPGDLDPDGNRVYYWIKNARLLEVSTVFKGACPGAYIDKARDMVSQGELEPSRIATLERRYQVRLDDGKRRFYFAQGSRDVEVPDPKWKNGDRVKIKGKPHMKGHTDGTVKIVDPTIAYGIVFDGMEDMGVHKWYTQAELEDGPEKKGGSGTSKKKMKNMKGEDDVITIEQIAEAVRNNEVEKRSIYEVLNKEGEKFRQTDDIALRNELGDNATVEGVKTLKQEAEQGRAYVADLIDQAVASRTRAQGKDFKADSYKQMLVRSADIEFIKDEIRSYEELVKKSLKPGRSTQGNDPQHRGEGEPDADVIVSENFKEAE